MGVGKDSLGVGLCSLGVYEYSLGIGEHSLGFDEYPLGVGRHFLGIDEYSLLLVFVNTSWVLVSAPRVPLPKAGRFL